MIQIGDLVQNRYQVIKVIGEGGFGRVFEVVDKRERDKRKVLKVLNLDRFSDEAISKRVINLFKREAEILQELSTSANSHQLSVPKVAPDGYFITEQDSSHCLVMEKIIGKNLNQIINQKLMGWQCYQPISQERAINWLRQLIGILDELHRRNFSHRDIKPANIIERSNGKLVLIDFGAVKQYTRTYLASIGEQEPGTQIISPGYTPKEQANGFPEPRSDFFALGRTFVHLLTGIHPNDILVTNGSTIPMNQNMQLNLAFQWRDKGGKISESFANLIDQMIDDNIENRSRNIQEIRDRLAEIENENRQNPWYGCQCLESLIPKGSVPLLVWTNLLLISILTGSVWLRLSLPSQPPSSHILRSQYHR